MDKTFTLLYICDNLKENNDELIDIEMITNQQNHDYREVWDLLENFICEVNPNIIKSLLNRVCQL